MFYHLSINVIVVILNKYFIWHTMYIKLNEMLDLVYYQRKFIVKIKSMKLKKNIDIIIEKHIYFILYKQRYI